MPHRILIVSDTHLGHAKHGVRSANALRPLWQGFDQLIINGDTAELHHPHYRAHAEQELAALREMCAADGVQLTLLPGNHDPLMNETRYLHLMNDQVLLMHGEALHPAIAPWSRRASDIKQRFCETLEQAPPHQRDQIDVILHASKQASLRNVEADHVLGAETSVLGLLLRPWAIARLLQYWREFPRLAANFLERSSPQSKIGIFGHSHRAGMWSVNGRIIINTGEFRFPKNAQGCVLEDQSTLHVIPIRFARSEYHLHDRPRASIDLTR